VLVLEIPDLTWFLRILSEYKAKTPKNVSFTIESIVFHSPSGPHSTWPHSTLNNVEWAPLNIQHGARSQNMTYFRLQFLIGPSITMLYPVLVYISDQQPIIFISEMDYPRAFVSFPRIAGSGNEIDPISSSKRLFTRTQSPVLRLLSPFLCEFRTKTRLLGLKREKWKFCPRLR
jgi:hypothetical protein